MALRRSDVDAAKLGPALAEVARTSALHGVQMAATAEALLVGDAKAPPRDLVRILQVLLDVCCEHGLAVTDTLARAFLADLRAASPSSKQGRAAGQLLALEPKGQARRVAALAAFRVRVERAERCEAARAAV